MNVKSRNESFTQRTQTRILEETPSDKNPFVASRVRLYGYDILDLIEKSSFPEVLFLLFSGALPDTDKRKLFEGLMIAIINLGPRHPATRAAMNAGVGKTCKLHILPIGLSIMGGEVGAGSVERIMRFMRKHHKSDPNLLLADIPKKLENCPEEGDWEPFPGFGTHYGGIDEMPSQIADQLIRLPNDGKTLEWGNNLSKSLNDFGIGWLYTGLAAAVFCDLGFHPRAGGGLFQLLTAPGLLAHALEVSNKPLTAMPFISDADYKIEEC